MTTKNRHHTRVLGKDLRPGDLTDFGLITKIDLTSDDPFWKTPNITFLDYTDAYYGPLTKELTLDASYCILYDRGTPDYTAELTKLAANISENISKRQQDLRTVFDYIREPDDSYMFYTIQE